nr:big defensin 6 [Crassostrea gigas]
MARKLFQCIFFLVLLTSPGLILANTMKDFKETENKRQVQALLPVAAYAGLAVPVPLFAGLVAAYGLVTVTTYAIKEVQSHAQHDSHSCANNRGWCRETCFSREYIDGYHSDVCGSFKCCRPS